MRAWGARPTTAVDVETGRLISEAENMQNGGRNVMAVTALSLAENIKAFSDEQRRAVHVHILMNGFRDEAKEGKMALSRPAWKKWFNSIFLDSGVSRANLEVLDDMKPGNNASFTEMMEIVKQRGDRDDRRDIVLLLEDDNVLLPTALVEAVELFGSVRIERREGEESKTLASETHSHTTHPDTHHSTTPALSTQTTFRSSTRTRSTAGLTTTPNLEAKRDRRCSSQDEGGTGARHRTCRSRTSRGGRRCDTLTPVASCRTPPTTSRRACACESSAARGRR